MSRSARVYSESGFSHVLLRGIGRQMLFEEANDYGFFISRLKKYSDETNVEVTAYCLMDNHVHLLLHDEKKELSEYMRRIGVSYAGFYNSKYGRVGHLFQDRYKSIPIESEEQLIKTYRYILQNPQKAGICDARDYQWSSYHEYGVAGSFTNNEVLVRLIGSFEEFETFMNVFDEEDENVKRTREFEPVRISDEEACTIMKAVLGIESGTSFQKYNKAERNEAIIRLRQHGLSVRQIERMTGIGRGIIQRVKVLHSKM